MMILLAYATHGQQVSHQYAYWLRYQAQIIFSPSWQWNNEIDNRRFFDPDVALQFITHSRLHYRTGRWDFGGGLTYSIAFAQKPEEGFDQGISELRPVIEASHEIPMNRVSIYNRIRIDDRHIQSDPDQSVLEKSTNIVRFRYRLLARIPLKHNEAQQPTISLRIADEIMFNNWKNTFDQNRIYAALDFILSEKFTLETGYIHIYQQRFGRDEYFDRHVLRISLSHKFLLK
jgi:hypothetical protein